MTATRRLSTVLPVLVLAAFALAATTTTALAATATAPSAVAAKKKHPPRRGGKVRVAWPAKHGSDRPKTRLTRWLARQVGATPSRCPAPRHSKVRCAKHTKTGGRASAARTRSVAGPTAVVAQAASAEGPSASIASSDGKDPLQLVRSFAIPTDDPAYKRTLNFSWTYDSAVVAAAFVSAGDQKQSERLLDQLAALQRTDGSIDSAFDVSTGGGSGLFTSGTIAWVGLADVTYDRTFSDERYVDRARDAADYLLDLRLPGGLVRGGPTVKWASTLHNLVAYAFLGELGDLLTARGEGVGARYTEAARRIGVAIDEHLIVRDDDGVHFAQGLDDPALAVDVQALGAVYLLGRGEAKDAQAVLDYAHQHFAVDDHAIEESSDPDTFNMTYADKGPLSGYRAFAGDGTPDLIWAEGTNEMRLAGAALGEDTSALDESIARWNDVTSGSAPLQADRTSDGQYGEFHVWPAAAPAAWSLLSQAAPSFFFAPGASPAVTSWTEVRGGDMIKTYPDGRVDMLAADGGERRVVDHAVRKDATATVDATLNYGSGWGVYLRASVDPKSTAMTGYCVQVDQGRGQIVVRQIDDDRELSAPLAAVTPKSGSQLTGDHRIVAHISGNTLAVSYDDEAVIRIPDLTAASAAAAKASGEDPASFPPPTKGRIGLRAWSSSQVLFQQATVTGG
jgi:hypothetical protein